MHPVGAAEPARQDRPPPVRLALRLRGAAHGLQLADLHLGRRDDGSPAPVAREVPGYDPLGLLVAGAVEVRAARRVLRHLERERLHQPTDALAHLAVRAEAEGLDTRQGVEEPAHRTGPLVRRRAAPLWRNRALVRAILSSRESFLTCILQ